MGSDEWSFPRKTILVDFDGTLGPFCFPGLPDKPYDGVVAGMNRLRELGFTIVIFTTRAWPGWKVIDGQASYYQKLADVRSWLEKWKVPYDDVTHEKIPAMFIVDDRALNPTLHGWERVVEIVENADRSDPYGRVRVAKEDADASKA